MTNKATEKQINYLLKLGATPEQTENLTIKEASIMIHKLLKNQKENTIKEKPAAEAQALDLTKIDYNALSKKYNAYYKCDNDGLYLDNNGANMNSEYLKDSRTFKSYITKVLKTEFPGVQFKISCSFAGYRPEIEVTILDTKTNLYKPFAEILQNDYIKFLNGAGRRMINHFYSHTITNNAHETAFYKRVYENYFINENQTLYSNSDEYINSGYYMMASFIDSLLSSFSYDHSSYMTDYYSYGLQHKVIFSATDAAPAEEQRELYKKINSIKNDNELLEMFPLSEEEGAELQKAFEDWRKKQDEEMEALRLEQERIKKEYEEERAATKKVINLIENEAEVTQLEEHQIIRGARFPRFNKPGTLQEVINWLEDEEIGTEAPEHGTVAAVIRKVNFKNQETLDYFKNMLLEEYSFLGCGGCCHVDLVTLEQLDYKECYKMSAEEMNFKGIGWMRECVLIELNGEAQFLVDPEGSNYCRYAGLLPETPQEAPVIDKTAVYYSPEEKELINRAETLEKDSSFTIYDFGAKRSTNKAFWDRLFELGTVKKEKYSWSFSTC